MLNAAQTLCLNRVVSCLLEHGETSLASEVNELLTDAAQQRSAMATAAKARKGEPRGRAPSIAYAVAMEPGWQRQAIGARAAHEIVKETLKEHGALVQLPTLASLRVRLSSHGSWTAMLETDNGVATLTVSLAR
jgi:hypothetical protein